METKLYLKKDEFDQKPSTTMHVDLNSCFASIEQQANPKLRGVPTIVAAYPTDGGCILAASVEAKKVGIKGGMRVKEARSIYRDVKVLTPDPSKYRYVHQQMMGVFETYTPNVEPKSIDEAVLIFDSGNLFDVGREIKRRIKSEIGEWLTVNVGIGPNRFLAKTAASIKKPDGLEEINFRNAEEQLNKLKLTDLCGINQALKLRLNLVGIFTPVEFLGADLPTLRSAFKSVNARHWYLRLRGYEVDDWRSRRRSIGHSYALPHTYSREEELSKILYRLCEKVGRRLRNNGFEASGINLNITYKDWVRFQQSRKLSQPIFSSSDIYLQSMKILGNIKNLKQVRNLAVSVFNLSKSIYQQQDLFENQRKKASLTQALDEINNKYGEFTVTLAPLIELKGKILDRIAFGGIRNLESFT